MKQVFLILLVISAVTAYNKLDLPYQAHSMNDLNLTLQELIKGVNNFKFDVSLATIESCENYSNWDRDYTQCGYFDYGLNTCCLALRGDCSQEPVFQQHFNTSIDMVDMVSNPKYAFIFAKNTTVAKYQQTKYFAFNFQYGTYDNSMTVDFIYRFLKAIEDHDLNVRMVTGTTGMLNMFDYKCVELQVCNEKELYIDNADIIIQSDSQTRVPRTQQFNEEPSGLGSQCKYGFPAYMKNGDVPFQFWEPSYQDSVYEVYDQFWSNRCIKLGIKDTVNRFKITSNLNSENYAAFLQRANDTSSDTYVPPKYRFHNTSDSIIEYNNPNGLTFISTFNIITQTYELSLYKQVALNKPIRIGLTFKEQVTKLSSKENFLQVETATLIQVYRIYYGGDLFLLRTYNKDSNYIASDLVVLNNIDAHVAISSFSGSSIQVKLMSVYSSSTEFTISQKVNQNVKAEGFKYVSSIIQDKKLIQVYTYESINEQNISEIYFFHHEVNIITLASKIIQPNAPLNYGSNSSLKIEEFDGKLYFVQVSGNGSCWSGVFINNGDWCKCTLHKNEKFVNLRNVQYSITYMWGRLDDLVERIQSSTFINSCDSRIMSSKVYNGRNPHITVKRDNENRPTAYVMMEYTHYDELPLLTTLFLGANSYEAEYANQSVQMTELISFDLLEYQIFNIPF